VFVRVQRNTDLILQMKEGMSAIEQSIDRVYNLEYIKYCILSNLTKNSDIIDSKKQM